MSEYIELYTDGRGTYRAHELLVEAVTLQAQWRVPQLHGDRTFTAREVIHDCFWRQLTMGERILVGRIFAWLVYHAELPFQFMAPGKYPLRYILPG